ncbi:hypothetical protein PF005_g5570 [Phytophthora fragariae]|uniref:START domain-containing protein n=2 Tax=Phytophthora fragariae TaxID=53985 RepID=A0A6A3M2A6_9STRA|nr:hypothetical protein PF011_g4523 [Phytophthora fragariae]KAE9225304.1 hypothetical protein PF005_g5570 [Phytophthora fragariae]KAE9247377.1 hypothetical protein PF002_g6307 [Phytophthora fragariae]KAE9353872.1 hypothetical protein PF008_g4787 [Phytophthora fragariae]
MSLPLSYAVLHPPSVVTPALIPHFVGPRSHGEVMELTPADIEYCRDITLNVLDRTFHDYADTASWASGSSSSRSEVEHDGWKRLRSQDNVSMYAERASDLSWVSSMRGGGWRHPVAVVAVGRICCSLQDVLYGLVVSDPAEFKLRAALMGQKGEDDVQIAAITVPSEGEPFQFMGVTRYIVNHGCLSRPQEYVLVTATGEVFTSCGEHLGYEITQSVSMSRWPVKSSAERKQVLQARVLRELPDGSVGVYHKIVVDSRNFIPDTVVQTSLWHAIRNFWKMTPRCAEAKKLCYCVEHSRDFNRSARQSPCRSADSFTCCVCGSPLLKRRKRSLEDIASAVHIVVWCAKYSEMGSSRQ